MKTLLPAVVIACLARQSSSFAIPSGQLLQSRQPTFRSASIPSDDFGAMLPVDTKEHTMTEWESNLRKVTMMTYVASMCVALPLSLFPVWLLSKLDLIKRNERETLALEVSQLCAKLLLMIMPFYKLSVESDLAHKKPEPSIWVCNHTSMLDTFVLLACDSKVRGPNKRPIKVIYWKGLEKNPVCNLLFQLCSFIPVDMADNGSGNANQYNRGSFKTLLRQTKKAFEEGFDILVLPEGQLNPCPERGLLEVFPGAHKLSLISKRPIQMVAFHGCHKFWHADENIGMKVTGKEVRVRAYGKGRFFESDEEFVRTFRTVVGFFGANGTDLPKQQVDKWLDGSAWEEVKQQESSTDVAEPPSGETGISKLRFDGVQEEIRVALKQDRDATLHKDDEKRTLEQQPQAPVGVHGSKPPFVKTSLNP